MRGTKRKRNIFTLSESVDHWFGASESLGHSSEAEEGAIERSEVDPSLQGHCNANGEGSIQSRGTQGGPVSCPVTEGPHSWLGLRCDVLVPSDGTEPGAGQVQANPRGPVSSHVDRRTASEEGGRPLPVVGGDTGPGKAGNNYPSLAKEALTWLEASNSSTTAHRHLEGLDRTLGPRPKVLQPCRVGLQSRRETLPLRISGPY